MSLIPNIPEPIDIMDFLRRHGDEFLVMDGRVPLLTSTVIHDEARLYNLDPDAEAAALSRFTELTGREAGPDTAVTTLSGGQKIVIAALLALESPATDLLFVDFFRSLYPARRRALEEIIAASRSRKRRIVVLSPESAAGAQGVPAGPGDNGSLPETPPC